MIPSRTSRRRVSGDRATGGGETTTVVELPPPVVIEVVVDVGHSVDGFDELVQPVAPAARAARASTIDELRLTPRVI